MKLDMRFKTIATTTLVLWGNSALFFIKFLIYTVQLTVQILLVTIAAFVIKVPKT